RISRTFDFLIRIGFHLLQQQLDCTLQLWVTTFEQFFWQLFDKNVRSNAFILDDILAIQVKYPKVWRSNASSMQQRRITRYPHKDTHEGMADQFTPAFDAERIGKPIIASTGVFVDNHGFWTIDTVPGCKERLSFAGTPTGDYLSREQ